MRRAALMGGQEVADWYIAATAIGDIQSRRYPKGIPKGSRQQAAGSRQQAFPKEQARPKGKGSEVS